MDHRHIKNALYAQFARIGRALASDKRLEILDLLAQGERPVEAIARETTLTMGNTSAHLQTLRRSRLVESRRKGQQVFYSLAHEDVFGLLRGLETLGRKQLAEVDQIAQLYYESRDELEPVSATELQRRLENDQVILVDVRPKEEYEGGHIPGALSVPPDEIDHRLAQLPHDQEIVAYCRGEYCLFSLDAVTHLRANGYRARRLAIGLPDWRAEGLPVETTVTTTG